MDDEDRRVVWKRSVPAESKTCESFRYKCGTTDTLTCPTGCYSVMGPVEMITSSSMCATCGTGEMETVQVACACPSDSPAVTETWRCADEPYYDEITGSGTRYTVGEDFCCDMQRFNDTPQGEEAWKWMGCPTDLRDCPRPAWHNSDIVKNMCVDANIARMLVTTVEVDVENTARDFRKPLN